MTNMRKCVDLANEIKFDGVFSSDFKDFLDTLCDKIISYNHFNDQINNILFNSSIALIIVQQPNSLSVGFLQERLI